MDLIRKRPIALVGMMGAGKSTLARLLGERLEAQVADLDDLIEGERGDTIARLFEREGEPAFRRRERGMLQEVLDAGARVIACGGGIVTDEASRLLLAERCRVVWLEVSAAEALRRIGAGARRRPKLAGGAAPERLAALLLEREELYRGVSELRVDTVGRTPAEVADLVLAAIAAKEPA